ncbi:MAG TPA: hypothetical protein VGP19_00325 [Candidatus Acidoferrales bacterium]|jgi:hypothetical protein|nr:hypothetical protein [Candidatus Acidoferrales bacterium]
MPNNGCKKAFGGQLETDVALDESAETILRQLKRTPAGTRGKLVQELRNLEMKRLRLLDQLDNLAKPA